LFATRNSAFLEDKPACPDNPLNQTRGSAGS
jgi:hypothetical protein